MLVIGLCPACRKELAEAHDTEHYLLGIRESGQEQLLSTSEAARLLRLSPHTVRRLVRTKKLRAVSTPARSPHGRRLRFKLADVQELLQVVR